MGYSKKKLDILKFGISTGRVSSNALLGAIGKGTIKEITKWRNSHKDGSLPSFDYLMRDYNDHADFQEVLAGMKITRKDIEGIVRDLLDNADKVIEAKAELPKIGRNAACPCGSGKKYKKCCLHLEKG